MTTHVHTGVCAGAAEATEGANVLIDGFGVIALVLWRR